MITLWNGSNTVAANTTTVIIVMLLALVIIAPLQRDNTSRAQSQSTLAARTNQKALIATEKGCLWRRQYCRLLYRNGINWWPSCSLLLFVALLDVCCHLSVSRSVGQLVSQSNSQTVSRSDSLTDYQLNHRQSRSKTNFNHDYLSQTTTNQMLTVAQTNELTHEQNEPPSSTDTLAPMLAPITRPLLLSLQN